MTTVLIIVCIVFCIAIVGAVVGHLGYGIKRDKVWRARAHRNWARQARRRGLST